MVNGLKVSIEVGYVKNKNKNPIAEKAVCELEEELTGSEIVLSWSPIQLKILHWRQEFHNWSPAGNKFLQVTIIIQTTTVIFS